MKITSEKGASLAEIVNVLDGGGLVVFPCETVYGVAVDAGNPEAVKKLNAYKTRPLGKPYAIMVCDMEMAEKYVSLNDTAKDLYRNFLPGPLTVISRLKECKNVRVKEKVLAEGVASELGTLGVRIPDYPFMLKIIKEFGRAIVATSANASYQKRPYKLDDIWLNISNKQKELITLAIDAGELPHNEPSTVIDTTLDDIAILRQGSLRLNDENEIFSRSEENTQNIGKELWQKYEQYAGHRAIVFALEGKMGAGKTQFTKGLARAMGSTDTIVSPSYDLNVEYQIKKTGMVLEHIDSWRMQESGELERLGLSEMVRKKCVLAIEWADRVEEVIRKYDDQAIIIWIKIEYGDKENERKISWGTV